MRSTSTSKTTPHTGAGRVRGLAVLGAVAAAVFVWLVADLLFDADLIVRPGGGEPQRVGVIAVAAVSLIVSLLGWALLVVLERRAARGAKVWTVFAVSVLLLSLVGPFTSEAEALTKAALIGMHLVVAAVVIPAFLYSSATRQQTAERLAGDAK